MISRDFSVRIAFCSGDGACSTALSIPAILPISVSVPVPVTITVAVPRVTEVFWNTVFERSPSAVSGSSNVPPSFGTGRSRPSARSPQPPASPP